MSSSPCSSQSHSFCCCFFPFPSLGLIAKDWNLLLVTVSHYTHGKKSLSHYFTVLCSEVQHSQPHPMKGDLASSLSALPHTKTDFHRGVLPRAPTAASLHASS